MFDFQGEDRSRVPGDHRSGCFGIAELRLCHVWRLELGGEGSTRDRVPKWAIDVALAQHDKRFELADTYGRLQRTRVLTHGDNAISFFEVS